MIPTDAKKPEDGRFKTEGLTHIKQSCKFSFFYIFQTFQTFTIRLWIHKFLSAFSGKLCYDNPNHLKRRRKRSALSAAKAGAAGLREHID